MPVAEWPLTGRNAELERIGAAVHGSVGVVLAGPAGVGKTRLAREALHAAAGQTGRARWIVASAAASSVPLGAFATFTGAELTESADAGLMARVSAMLHKDVAVIGVDDAHLLDATSAALLHQLAAAREVRLLVTVRTGEPAPDAVTALWKDGLLERIEVDPLSAEVCGNLLTAVLGGPVDRISSDRLVTAADGNVLWLRQLVDGERGAGRLAPVMGRWHWSGDPQLSPALGALIDDRIGRLGNDEREALELLALGEPLEVGVLTTLVDPAAVEEVTQRGLASVEPGQDGLEVRLAHPLYGTAVRANIKPVRSRRLHGFLAAALAGSRDRPGMALRRALLLMNSDAVHDAVVLHTGASEAAGAGDGGLAVGLARAACAAGGGFEPQLLLAFLVFWASHPEEAEHEFAVAAALAADDPSRIRVASIRACNIALMIGDCAAAQTVCDVAERSLDDPARAVELNGARAAVAVVTNDLPAAAMLTDTVFAAADPSPAARSYAGWAYTILAAHRGWRPGDDEAMERTYEALAQGAETAPLRINVCYWQLLGLALSGAPDAARTALVRFSDLHPAADYMMGFFRSAIELAAGRVDTAAQLCDDARPYFPNPVGGWLEILEAAASQAYAMAGDAQRAAAALGRAEAVHGLQLGFLGPNITLTRAWVAAAQGAVSEAARLADAAGSAARDSRQWAIEVVARHTAVCFGDLEQHTRLTELLDLVPGPRAAAAAVHAGALAAADTTGLRRAADMFDDAGMLLLAADATAQAAVLFRRRAQAPESMAAAARAAELASRCGGARTPALIAATTPLPITGREREVAALAGGGLTNKQIAARLHVSVRTVEGHIYHACMKLGLADRAQLAEMVGKLG